MHPYDVYNEPGAGPARFPSRVPSFVYACAEYAGETDLARTKVIAGAKQRQRLGGGR